MECAPAETDFVVIGAGIAGLRAAIELANAGRVVVLAKREVKDSATQLAQGGIAAALSDEDEISLHLQDTLNGGDGRCNPEAARLGTLRLHPCSSPAAAWGSSIAIPRILRLQLVMALLWRFAPAPKSATWSLSNFILRLSILRMPRDSCFRKRCGARAVTCAILKCIASCPSITPWASLRRAMWWRGLFCMS